MEFDGIKQTTNRKSSRRSEHHTKNTVDVHRILQMGRANTDSLSQFDIAQLQKTIGNKAVCQLLTNKPVQKETQQVVNHGVVQMLKEKLSSKETKELKRIREKYYAYFSSGKEYYPYMDTCSIQDFDDYCSQVEEVADVEALIDVAIAKVAAHVAKKKEQAAEVKVTTSIASPQPTPQTDSPMPKSSPKKKGKKWEVLDTSLIPDKKESSIWTGVSSSSVLKPAAYAPAKVETKVQEEEPISQWSAINDAYQFCNTPKVKNGSDFYRLTPDEVIAVCEEWESLGGKYVEPESRFYKAGNHCIMIHLNYKGKSYHVFLLDTRIGEGLREAFLKKWPKSGQLVVH